jgi:Skp family chaperone for outer membrane proteins
MVRQTPGMEKLKTEKKQSEDELKERNKALKAELAKLKDEMTTKD